MLYFFIGRYVYRFVFLFYQNDEHYIAYSHFVIISVKLFSQMLLDALMHIDLHYAIIYCRQRKSCESKHYHKSTSHLLPIIIREGKRYIIQLSSVLYKIGIGIPLLSTKILCLCEPSFILCKSEKLLKK